MKIGILTFHFARNYGAVLQCYALQRYLTARGHEVRVVDYRPSAVAGGYRWFDVRRFWGSDPVRFYKKTTSELKVIADRKRRYSAFERFVQDNLSLTPEVTGTADIEMLSHELDMFIIGSDQIWNPRITGGIDLVYWGDFVHRDASVISYAASMEDGFSEQVKDAVRNLLPGFSAISVREESLKASILEIKPELKVSSVADPTILAGSGIWDAITDSHPSGEPYLLYYQVRRSPEAYAAALSLAESKGLRLLCLSAKVELENSQEIIASSPQDFVSLFRNASYVVTTSFHGTVFSILFRKQFVCIDVADGKGKRQSGLLNALGLSDRICSTVSVDMPLIDWDEVDKRMCIMKKESEEYIESCGL